MVDPRLALFLAHVQTCCDRARDILVVAGQFSASHVDVRVAAEKIDEIEEIRDELADSPASLTFEDIDSLSKQLDEADEVLQRIMKTIRQSVVN